MQVGELVKHNAKPDWGIGVVVELAAGKVRINFENHGQVLLDAALAAKFLTSTAADQVPADSPLRDPERWTLLAPSPEDRSKSKTGNAGTSRSCDHCGQPLNRAQYSTDRKKKSCPRCSTEDAKQHVFYDSPDAFGTTDARESDESPEGVQSYCAGCRGRVTTAKPARCSSVL